MSAFRQHLDPVTLAAGCVVVAAGAAAVATALSPDGYRHGSRLAAALLLGALVSLLLLALTNRLASSKGGGAYAAMTGTLVLLLTVGGARMLVSRTSSGASQANDATAVEAFRSWTQQAIPLLVRYRHALAADATPRTASGRLDRLPRDRVERARRRLGALEPAVRQVARRAPSNLQPFMPQLLRSVTLAAEAQARYEAALATHGRRSRLLRGQADVLLRRSQKAMAAFSFGVNGVGGRLTGS